MERQRSSGKYDEPVRQAEKVGMLRRRERCAVWHGDEYVHEKHGAVDAAMRK